MKGKGALRRVINYKGQLQTRRIKNLKQFNKHYVKGARGYIATAEWAEHLAKRRGVIGDTFGKNHQIIITLYKYETGGTGGRTLELDIVGRIVLSSERFGEVKDIKKLMVSFVVNNLQANSYAGLAKAFQNGSESDQETEKGDNKFGIEITKTNEDEADFEFIRFFINGVDYTDKVETGVPNYKSKKYNDELMKNDKQGKLQ